MKLEKIIGGCLFGTIGAGALLKAYETLPPETQELAQYPVVGAGAVLALLAGTAIGQGLIQTRDRTAHPQAGKVKSKKYRSGTDRRGNPYVNRDEKFF